MNPQELLFWFIVGIIVVAILFWFGKIMITNLIPTNIGVVP